MPTRFWKTVSIVSRCLFTKEKQLHRKTWNGRWCQYQWNAISFDRDFVAYKRSMIPNGCLHKLKIMQEKMRLRYRAWHFAGFRGWVGELVRLRNDGIHQSLGWFFKNFTRGVELCGPRDIANLIHLSFKIVGVERWTPNGTQTNVLTHYSRVGGTWASWKIVDAFRWSSTCVCKKMNGLFSSRRIAGGRNLNRRKMSPGKRRVCQEGCLIAGVWCWMECLAWIEM